MQTGFEKSSTLNKANKFEGGGIPPSPKKTMTTLIMRGDPTRNEDFGHIEEARDRGSVEAGKALDKAYQRSRDENLIRARQRLIDAHRYKDVSKSVEIENQIREYERDKYGR